MFSWYASMWILIPAVLLGIYAQIKVQSAFAKWSKVRNASGMTGAQAAERMLRAAGVSGVVIQPASGMLSDHYNPMNRTLNLSEPVYGSSSIAAVGVAAHEAGHAIQHAKGYFPLALRTVLVPAAQFGNYLWIILFIIGFAVHNPTLMWAGIAVFSAAVVFTIITLPVEFNASSRAVRALESSGTLVSGELDGAKAVLGAAALTYVAAALMAILQLLRLVLLARRN